ncbi:MAG: ABC transporter substrate-binding protein [Nitrospiraceae bacterium]
MASAKLVAICLLIGAGLSCVSCTPDDPRSPGAALVFKHGKMSAGPGELALLLKDFEHRHPGITIREEILPSSSDQQHQFYAINLEGRSAAFDVLALDMIWVQEFARAGWIREVDELLRAFERSDYFSSAIDAAMFNGHLYAIPWYVDAGVLFYRRDLLERYGLAVPKTWSDLVQTTRTIVKEERDPHLKGFVWQGKQYEGFVCSALEFVWGNNGHLLNGPAAETEEALAFMRDLIVDDISPGLVMTADEEVTRHVFGSGRAIFMRNWPYAWSLLQTEGSPVRGKIGLGPLPSFSGQSSSSVLGGWMLAIPRSAEHSHNAEQLIRFLTDSDTQKKIAQQIGYKPSRRSLYHDDALLRQEPWLADLYPIVDAARSRPVTPYYLMLSQVWQSELSAVMVGRRSPREALRSAQRQTSRIVGIDAPPQSGVSP